MEGFSAQPKSASVFSTTLIGSFAINYGQNLHHQDIVNVCVAVLLVTVSLLQGIGSFLASRTTNRKLFRPKLHTRKN